VRFGHAQNCSERIWEDENHLISEREVVGRKCGACSEDWKLWESILQKTADEKTGEQMTLYGDLAYRGFGLVRKVCDYRLPLEDLEAFDYELLQIVYGAIKQREAFKIWERNKELEKDNA
jgi:hypothetical protein